MKIPDTLETNYGDLIFGTLLYNSFFGIRSSGFDSITPTAFVGSHNLDKILIKYSKMRDGSITWNYDTRVYECLYIPTSTGKYVIDGSIVGRLEMTATNGQSWLINPILSFDSPRRYEQYNSWIPDGLTSDEYLQLNQKKAWYNFEVVE